SSYETEKMDLCNITKLRKKDELKFVIAQKADFMWSRDIIRKYKCRAGDILFSPVKGRMSFGRLANLVMEYIPGARVQANIHKLFSLR
ncbi:hypothetical protein ACFLTD_02445, partial [Elusimicrobiota bacterium]